MTGNYLERRIEDASFGVLEPRAARALKVLKWLVARQNGGLAPWNHRVLGKRALIATAAAIVAVQVVGRVGVARLSRTMQDKRIEKAVVRELERQRSQESSLAVAPSTFYERKGKRLCDIAVGIVALPVVGMVTAACGIAIHREDGGPIFYNAPRVGKDGREFTMYKLRSMKVDSPDLVMEDGSTYNGADDPRMTRVGALMRKASLDEIPQFLNVLKGDMSVVGPRPDLKRETELYRGDESLKLTVKPGVTGYAAVYGRNSLPWHDRLALDVYYVRHRSFALDVKVFFKTFLVVFSQEGVYVEEEGAGEAVTRGEVEVAHGS